MVFRRFARAARLASRSLLVVVLLVAAPSVAGAGSTPKILIGMGPEADQAMADPLVETTPIHMLASWFNGHADLSWITTWKQSVIPKAYGEGDALHLVVYDDANDMASFNAPFGDGKTCGLRYPLSSKFLRDMATLAQTFAGQADGPPLYVTLFTEFETYVCPQDNGGGEDGWSSSPASKVYFKALKTQYMKAMAIFRTDAPNAQVSLGWGGWQTSFDDQAQGAGSAMFSHFASVLRASQFESFQALQDDSNPNNTNPGDITAMTKELSSVGGHPVMVSYFEPQEPNGAADQAAFDADVKTIFTSSYLRQATRDGLFAFSFMNDSLASKQRISGIVAKDIDTFGRR